jgi:hypothetical protein
MTHKILQSAVESFSALEARSEYQQEQPSRTFRAVSRSMNL